MGPGLTFVQDGTPLVVGALVWVGHFLGCGSRGAEKGTQEWDRWHGFQDAVGVIGAMSVVVVAKLEMSGTPQVCRGAEG